MKQWKNNLDERQEQALLKIEHTGCWLAFWGLLIALMVQVIAFGPDMGRLAGEWIVFMILSIYLVAACLKNGIWDRHFQPNAKTNLSVSLVAGLAVGLFTLAVGLTRFPGKPWGVAAAAFLGAAVSFALCFGLLSLMAAAYKRRQRAMEAESEE